MAYTPTNNPYIPGDPFSYDLKWIVTELKKAISLYTPLSSDFNELRDYVQNYFNNLDLTTEVSAKINEMFLNGTFDTIIAPYFDSYQEQISDLITDQATLSARMDTFASLPDGSTAGNAELTDIRVGAYGETYDSAGNAVRGQISNISDQNTNICDMSQLQIGLNWLEQANPARAILYINVEPNTTYYVEFPVNANLLTIDIIEKTATENANLQTTYISGGSGSAIIKTTGTTRRFCIQFGSGSYPMSSSMFDNYYPFVGRGDRKYTADDVVARSGHWYNKTLVWLGTSIPAAGRYDIANENAYPAMVGEKLGATVLNEAVGSSALHCKKPELISAANPYGFEPNFEAVSRCLTNSLAEMNWVIGHYNDSAVFTQNVPASLSDADKAFIRSCSWEVKLNKYFSADTFPDAWIIDHGHNDIPSEASEATYYDKTDMAGSTHSGYYSNGAYVSSSASSYIEYDVSNELFVWISGTFGAWYDFYDLYDANNNNIGHSYFSSENQISGWKINTANAAKLRVSNVNTYLDTISVQRLTYPMYNSLYSYQGGLDFIVNKILTYNPKAKIIMIGEYENQKYPTISENQVIAAERWELPLMKLWQQTGLSQQPILVNGSYTTMLRAIIPDNVHPHSDTSGFALDMIATNISAWLNSIY